MKTLEEKNLLWVLVRVQPYARQKVSGWSGFNISVSNKVKVRQVSVGFLPTINAPATNKGTLAKELEKSVSFADVITQPSACTIDAMALVQRLIGDHKTFAEVAKCLLCLVLHAGSNSKIIDAILTYTKNTPSRK